MNQNNNQGKKVRRGVATYFLILLVGLAAVSFFSNKTANKTESYTYTDFKKDLSDNKISKVVVTQNEEVPTGSLAITMKKAAADGNDDIKQLYVTDVNKVCNLMDEENLSYTVKDVETTGFLSSSIVSIIIIVVMGIFMMLIMTKISGGGANARAMSFGKNRAKLHDPKNNKINFSNVAGLKEEKESLIEVVDFLKDPSKYIKLGARIPKGVILVGPPGTGKTLLAKAVAGEAKVPFYSISGSDFVEMFVGVGASRVREMFAEAKKHSPCIVFIDEIDAVARRRGTGMGGGHDEREQTLNQLLVEMDGFGINEGIIVMAATNRVDILDPAIMRPGRFDRKVMVGSPDIKGREEILKVHCKNKPLGDDISIEQIAAATAGFTGADLENLMNESAIGAAANNRPYIIDEDVKKAFIKVGVGTEKKSRVITEKEKKITAYHEAGHAILYHVLPDEGPVYTVSIIPTGGAAGYTMKVPEKEEMFNTRGKMLQSIMVALGGRIAEEQIFDDITTGASQDIKQATTIARTMVTKYGMSKSLGLICYDNDSDEVVIGRDIAHSRAYGEQTAAQIDIEVKNIIDECYVKAQDILKEYSDVLDRCAKLLLEKERINRQEFEALFNTDEAVISEESGEIADNLDNANDLAKNK